VLAAQVEADVAARVKLLTAATTEAEVLSKRGRGRREQRIST
jgi:hypothetical protein